MLSDIIEHYNHTEKCVMNITIAGRPGFEPGSEAPEAPMLSRLYYRPISI